MDTGTDEAMSVWSVLSTHSYIHFSEMAAPIVRSGFNEGNHLDCYPVQHTDSGPIGQRTNRRDSA